MLGPLDADVGPGESIAQETREHLRLFHGFQRSFQGDRQAHVALFIAAPGDGFARFDLIDHAHITTQQAGRDGEVRVGIRARQAVFNATVLRVGVGYAQADGTVFQAPLDVHRCRGVRQEAAERVDVGREQRQRLGDVLLQAADMVRNSSLMLPSALEKTDFWVMLSTTLWCRCMALPGSPVMGLAMNVAVTLCLRAASRMVRLKMKIWSARSRASP